MSKGRAALAAGIALLAAGCSIRPTADLPGGPRTFEIVKQIRCETYLALRDDLIELVKKAERSDDPKTQARPGTAKRLEQGSLSFDALSANDVGPDVASQIKRYRKTTIGYSFSFDVTEANNLSANANFVEPLGKGPFGLNLGGQADRSRQNVRTFRIVDVWENLLEEQRAAKALRAKGLDPKSNAKVCQDYEKLGENLIVPVHGKIGMQNQIRLFYELNETGGLAGATDDTPTLTDTLSFLSTIRGSVNPTIQIGLKGSEFQLVQANLTAEARRSDVHKVIIVITLPAQATTKTAGEATVEAKERTVDELVRQENLQAPIINPNEFRTLLDSVR